VRDELTFWRTDWAEEDTELPSGNQHLWEESWDDDETNDDFSKQLAYFTCFRDVVGPRLTIVQGGVEEG
jgi:hypothetical protein